MRWGAVAQVVCLFEMCSMCWVFCLEILFVILIWLDLFAQQSCFPFCSVFRFSEGKRLSMLEGDDLDPFGSRADHLWPARYFLRFAIIFDCGEQIQTMRKHANMQNHVEGALKFQNSRSDFRKLIHVRDDPFQKKVFI